MYLLTVNLARELVHLAFVGQVDKGDSVRCRAEIEALVPTLKPGFCLLTDLSGLEEMDVACAEDIRAVMEAFRKQGIARIVRVIPDHRKDIGFTVMSYFHYGHDVVIQTFEFLAQALKTIDT